MLGEMTNKYSNASNSTLNLLEEDNLDIPEINMPSNRNQDDAITNGTAKFPTNR
jgi:hypothetical protein